MYKIQKNNYPHQKNIDKRHLWPALLDTHMESIREVTLVDTPDIQVQASLNIMALANSTDSSFIKRNNNLETVDK